MRVAVILKTFPPDIIGGMETQTKSMARELHRNGNDITVFTKRFGNHDDTDVPYEVVRIYNWHFTPFVSDLSFLAFTLLELIRRSDEFDVLQCMMIYPVGFLGYILNKITGLPYFAWIRGGDYYLMKDVCWKRWMISRVLSDTLVLVQSEKIQKDVLDDFSSLNCDLEVLGNAVSVPDKIASGTGVLYVGRLVRKKGLKYLIQAIAELNTHLTIVGDGPERERLESLADKVESEVTFIGEVSPTAVDEYYQSSEIFVLPSIEGEGLPNAVLEAMSWGLPVIVTNSGGLPNVIQDGKTGYLVPMRDPERLQNRLNILLENPEKRNDMGATARRYVQENHSWDMLVGRLESIYRSCVKHC